MLGDGVSADFEHQQQNNVLIKTEDNLFLSHIDSDFAVLTYRTN